MKESGIDWIGKIPEEWRVRPIKHIVETPVTDGPHETPVLYETGIPFLSAEAVKDGVLDFNFKRGYISLKDHDRFKKKISPKKDDIFIVKSGATTGNVGIVNTDDIFDIWSPLALIRCNKTLAIQKYIYFYLLSTLFKSQVEFNWSFGTQQNIGMGVIERIKVILPPVSEQQKIVEVLDKKIAQLDKAKALLEEQIQKLKDYCASLIYETVTKGLDKNPLMKDSGVDWIGQVPEGWEIGRVKDAFKLRSEKNFRPIEEVQLLSLYTEFGVFPHGDREEKGNKAVSTEGYKIVYKKDIVVNIILAWMGSIGISEYDGVTSPAYDIYEPLEGVCSKFFHYLFRTEAFSGQCYKYGKGIMKMRWRTYSDDFKTIEIPIPDYNSQVNIVKFLDDKLKIINQLIDNKQTQIENINKQRQTLIYDYVTGKRRV